MGTDARIPVILDVDTGIDDAIAILLACRSTKARLLGVTVVAGNTSVQQATVNTLRLLDHLGANRVPVHAGMSEPLVGPTRNAAHYHGQDGLGGLPLPASTRSAASASALDFLLGAARAYPGRLCLVCLGPLTNLAIALKLEPSLPDLISRVIVMGGAFWHPGNATEYAEFNVWADPEAADVVARSRLPVTYIGLDVTHRLSLTRDAWERYRRAESTDLRLVADLYRESFVGQQRAHVFLHDPLAYLAFEEPAAVTTEAWSVVVNRGPGDEVGRTSAARDPTRPVHAIAVSVSAESVSKRMHGLLVTPPIPAEEFV